MKLPAHIPVNARDASRTLAVVLRDSNIGLTAELSAVHQGKTAESASYVVTPRGQRTGAERRFEVTVREMIAQ